MQPVLDFFRDAWSLYAQLIGDESTLAVISFWMGLLSFVAGLAASLYSYKSAQRSDKLLRRLVVYPFRELDRAMSNLAPLEREYLVQLYQMSNGKRSFSLDDAEQELGQFARASLNSLVEGEWLLRQGREEPEFRINPDRRPYLVFHVEATKHQ